MWCVCCVSSGIACIFGLFYLCLKAAFIMSIVSDILIMKRVVNSDDRDEKQLFVGKLIEFPPYPVY